MNHKQFFVGRAVVILILLIIGGLVVGFYAFNNYIYEQKQPFAAKDFKQAEYLIEGQPTKLVGDTKFFGNELKTDLDGDGRDDVVFLITQNKGGSGTFYYAVAALNTDRGYVGGQALFLGDRIAPQTTEKGKWKIVIINYADRALTDSFATPPSIAKSIWLLFDPKTMQFGEVVQNFEGESNIPL